MKTLDEVIAELYIWDTCDKYPESFYDDEVTRDALHYLKEYQAILPLVPSLINTAIAVQKKGKTIG
jgi:hypothetical protein